MKEIIVSLRWDDEKMGQDFINLEALESLLFGSKNTHPKLLKIARYWEPEMNRICKCGRKGYHIEWSPDEGEEWSCCDCWVAKGNAPAAHHARLKKYWLAQVRELIENNTMGLIRNYLLEPVEYTEDMREGKVTPLKKYCYVDKYMESPGGSIACQFHRNPDIVEKPTEKMTVNEKIAYMNLVPPPPMWTDIKEKIIKIIGENVSRTFTKKSVRLGDFADEIINVLPTDSEIIKWRLVKGHDFGYPELLK